MSAKKKKKKRNTVSRQAANRQYRARKKGGRYVYPAGTFTARRTQASITPALPEPVIKPEETEVILPKAADTAVLPISESESRLPRQYLIAMAAFAAAGVIFATSRISGTATETLSADKLQPLSRLHAQLQITEAELPSKLNAVVTLDSVQGIIEDYLSQQEGTWAVYLKNLSTGEELTINGHQMESASLIKLFVAGRYFEALENHEITATSRSEQDLARMISWSDNDAWQDLETIIGGSYTNGLNSVTEFARSHGYTDTGRLIGGDSIYSAAADNLTSVADVGRVLDEIYNGTYVSEEASRRILELMKDQHIVTKIPAGLPEGIASANKTGELTGVENDAAIVYGLNTDYILVIMNEDNYVGTEPVARLSAIIYHELNPGSGE